MSSREKILEAVLKNQPATTPLPDITIFQGNENDKVEKYINVFKAIGGSALLVDDTSAVKNFIQENFASDKRIITTLPELNGVAEILSITDDPHAFENIELAIIRAHFAVAE